MSVKLLPPISRTGRPAEKSWTGLFRPGERMRLRFYQRLGNDLFRYPYPRAENDGRGCRWPVCETRLPLAIQDCVAAYDVVWSLRVVPSSHNPWTGPVALEGHWPRRELNPAFPLDPPSSVDHGRYGYGGMGHVIWREWTCSQMGGMDGGR